MLKQETRGCDVGFVAVLLEEHPLKCQSPTAFVVGEKFYAAREVCEDRVRLGQDKAVVVKHRRPAIGVDLQKLGRAALALEDVHLDDRAGNSELRQQQPDFIRVARVGDV